ncbi:MAG: BNR-repeat neuraminidase N-terminal domain-containing protein, partial [Bacteroidota bacterium]
MKTKLLVLFTLCLSLNVFAQTSYNTSYFPNSGNPGGVNTEPTDNLTAGWGILIAPAISTNQWSASFALPFAFQFYGNPVTSLRASANGLVSFAANPSLADNNTDLPSGILPDSTIACFWDAFTNTPATGNNDSVCWKVFGSAPNRQLWIKWATFESGSPSVSAVTYSCVLEETTNNIYMVESDFAVNISTALTSVTTGVQLNTSTAKQYDNKYRQRPANATTSADNNYILFSPFALTNMAVSSAECSQPVLNKISKNTINNPIIRVRVPANGELNALALTQLSFNTNGTFSTSDITSARVFYTGGDSTFNALSQFGSAVSTPIGAFNV